MASIESIEQLLPQVRRDILRMVHQVNSGHPGGSLGCAEFFVSLYQHVMDYSTDFSMDGKNEDLFFLSNVKNTHEKIRLIFKKTSCCFSTISSMLGSPLQYLRHQHRE